MGEKIWNLSLYSRCLSKSTLTATNVRRNSTKNCFKLDNCVEKHWIQIEDNSDERGGIKLVYDQNLNYISVENGFSRKEIIRAKKSWRLQVFVKHTSALFIVVSLCNKYRQFKVQFSELSQASDFYATIKSSINIRKIYRNDGELCVGIKTVSNEVIAEESYSLISASVTTVNSSPELNDEQLDRVIDLCLSDPEFPLFVEQLRRKLQQRRSNTK